MKRKMLTILGIVLGVLLLLFIVVGPAAPLWARLGIKPFCIQGEWPHLQITSCAQAQSQVTPMPLPSLNGQPPIPIIVDDDGSPDGMIALLFFLKNPLYDVRAVTISCGEAHPSIFAERILQLLAGLGREDIPVGAGRETPLEGNNVFPDPWREASDNFWEIDLPDTVVSMNPTPAAQLIVDTVRKSPQPVLIFVSGNHTNLAEALRIDPGIRDNIRDVFIVGGSVYVPGNINSDWSEFDNKVAEWNIWVDPVAADEVFTSGVPLHLMPLDATQKVLWTQSDLETWESTSSPESNLARELLEWMLNSWSETGVYIWDLVAATQATNPALCPEVSLAVEIITTPGPDQGRTAAIQGTPNVGVCLEPDAGQIKALAAYIIGD